MGYRVEETIEADSKSSAADLVATRVNGESMEVVSSDAVPVGEWVAFELRLRKGDVFLEGVGRCEACASSGRGHRVRLGTLQFDTMNEVMFERVHLAAESLMTGERTGEVDIAALEALRKAELAPRPSPSMSPPGGPPKIPSPMSTPSWRPPPPMRTRPSPSAPPRPRTPSIRVPAAPLPAPLPRPQISMRSSAPPPAEPLGALKTTKTDMPPPRAEFSPSGYPPIPRQPRAPAPIAPPVSVEPVEPVVEPAFEPRTVSGFPAPPPEPMPQKVPDATRSVGAFSSSSKTSSRFPPKSETGSSRERLEPLLLAMRRGGAALHLEDAEELAMELGLQALERIFGES
ncbi:MAG: hypothetical protein ACI9KE_004270 [Polyangiales bacterium]|jgi:hypothetical protein